MLWLNGPYSIFGMAYALMGISFLIAVWITTLAQRLYKTYQLKNTAYFVANFIWSAFYVSVGYTLAIVTMQISQELAEIMLLFSILLATIRLLASIWHRIRQGRRIAYSSRYWRLVTGDNRFWRIWHRWTIDKTVDITSIEKTAAAIPSRTATRSVGTSPWHRVSIPADIEPKKPIPIPPREEVLPSKDGKPATITEGSRSDASVALDSPEHRKVMSIEPVTFVEQAKQLVARSERKVNPVPFSRYWPTYEQMSADQQRWYFYWRSELRIGNFLPTDLSYLFVYVYECINVIGFENPQTAFERLVTFWQYYRELQPKLDNYLIDWIADFAVIHQLPVTALDWYAQVAKLGVDSTDVEMYIESWLHTGKIWEEFSSVALFRLAEFSPKRSKFRKMYQKQDLDAAYKEGLKAVDSFLQQSQGTSLFAMNAPSTIRVVQRSPFASAHHGYGSRSITIAEIRPWLRQKQLRKQLKSIIKQTENVLREQQQFETKLLGIDLPPSWGAAIQRAFVVAPEKRTVTIDFAEVAELQRASEEIRQRFIVTDDDEVQTSIIPQNDTHTVPTIDESIVDTLSVPVSSPPIPDQTLAILDAPYLQRPDNVPDHLLTDLVEVSIVMGDATSQEAALLALFYNHQWEISSRRLIENPLEQFVTVALDRINERAIEQLGDALIFADNHQWVIAEDYRDEISYILEHPAYQNPHSTQNYGLSNNGTVPPNKLELATASQSVPDADSDIESPTEWATLAQTLQSEQKAAISFLLVGGDVSKQLDLLARTKHITVNQLIDQVNEAALEIIGDIIIVTNDETPTIEEEYLNPLAEILGAHPRVNDQSTDGVMDL